jgi:predicted DNA-binding ribbon-helix-helix protein
MGRIIGGNVKYVNGTTSVNLEQTSHVALSRIALENEITLTFLYNYIVSEFIKDETAVATAIEIGKERVIADKMRAVQKKIDALNTQMAELEAESKWSYRVD